MKGNPDFEVHVVLNKWYVKSTFNKFSYFLLLQMPKRSCNYTW